MRNGLLVIGAGPRVTATRRAGDELGIVVSVADYDVGPDQLAARSEAVAAVRFERPPPGAELDVLAAASRARVLVCPEDLRAMTDPAVVGARLRAHGVPVGSAQVGRVFVVDGVGLHVEGAVDSDVARAAGEDVAAVFPDAFSFAVHVDARGGVVAVDPWPEGGGALVHDGVDPFAAELLAISVERPFPEGGTAFDGARET